MSTLKVNNIAGVSGGTSPPITLSGDTATLSGTGVTFPAGHAVQIVGFQSSTVQNVTTSNATNITPTEASITIKNSNPLILYHVLMGAEPDASSYNYVYFRALYKNQTDGGSYAAIDNPNNTNVRINGNPGIDSMGGCQSVLSVYHNLTADAGDQIYYIVEFEQYLTASYQFNQQSLSGQPSGSSNFTQGYIMEFSR